MYHSKRLINIFHRLFFSYYRENKYERKWFLSFKVCMFISIKNRWCFLRPHDIRLQSRLVPQLNWNHHQ